MKQKERKEKNYFSKTNKNSQQNTDLEKMRILYKLGANGELKV